MDQRQIRYQSIKLVNHSLLEKEHGTKAGLGWTLSFYRRKGVCLQDISAGYLYRTPAGFGTWKFGGLETDTTLAWASGTYGHDIMACMVYGGLFYSSERSWA